MEVVLDIDQKISLRWHISWVGDIKEYALVSSNKNDADAPAEMSRKLLGGMLDSVSTSYAWVIGVTIKITWASGKLYKPGKIST